MIFLAFLCRELDSQLYKETAPSFFFFFACTSDAMILRSPQIGYGLNQGTEQLARWGRAGLRSRLCAVGVCSTHPLLPARQAGILATLDRTDVGA